MKRSKVKKVSSLLTLTAVAISGCLPPANMKDLLATKGLLDANGCLSSSASIVGLSNTSMSINGNAKINGSVVLLGKSQIQLVGNASVEDKIYAATADQVTTKGNAKVGQIVQKDFTLNEFAVL
ncbi:MAG: hypothetical protein ABIQ95_04855, partial [Bdellovibrionia bacterium]